MWRGQLPQGGEKRQNWKIVNEELAASCLHGTIESSRHCCSRENLRLVPL